MSKKAVFGVVKNEGRDIGEWLAYHFIIGFDSAIVFDNGSTDDTRDVVLKFTQKYDARLILWERTDPAYQKDAYLDGIRRFGEEFQWGLFIDSDEFLVDLDFGFLSKFDSSVSQVLLNWATFGSSGHRARPSGLIIENFLYRAPQVADINRHTKAFARMADVLDCSSPHFFHVSGKSVDIRENDVKWSDFPGAGVVDGLPLLEGPRVNHYWTKSATDWAKKNVRGYPDQPNIETRGDAELAAFDQAAIVRDETLLHHANRVREVLADLGLAMNQTAVTRRGPLLETKFQGVVMDIGVSEGNDTAFYLAKGFQVVAVEADPGMCRTLRSRFAREIESGAVILLNFAAGAAFGATVKLLVHSQAQGISSIYRRAEVDPAGYSEHEVLTIDWHTLLSQVGMPRYVKVDIERQEDLFLAGMLREHELPEFISIEAYAFRPCEMLHEMGYNRFKLIDQNPSGGFQLPTRQWEGLSINFADFSNASGPFGLDVFGDGQWLDFAGFRAAWDACQPEMSRTWFDCHAWRPN